MKTAGIRGARQNLSAPIDEVKKGREIVITERGVVRYRHAGASTAFDPDRLAESV